MRRWYVQWFMILILLSSTLLWGQTTDLFFSEYIEGSSFNKAVEIYNGTGAAVDLSQYTLELYSNGNSSPNSTTTLSGTLADGDVYVAAHASADAAILAVADMTNSGVINFNGDDAFALRKAGALIDVIGQIGTDPGSEWGSGATSTKDNTIRRQESICGGDTNGSDAFDPATEWNGYAQDTFDGLGSHTANCGGGPTLTPIYDIQYTTDPGGDSPENGQTVNTEGVVTAVFSNGYVIQDGNGAWNGLWVDDNTNSPAIGDDVELAGSITETANRTTLSSLTSYQVSSSGNALPTPTIVSTANASDEQWEGVLIQVENVTVTNASLGNGEWSVSDGSGDLRVDDKGSYTYSPALDDELDSVTGPLDFSDSVFKIQPRDDNDIVQAAGLTSIYDIQYTTAPGGDSPLNGQSVTIQGIVTAQFSNGYFIQEATGGPWTGLFIYDTNTPAIGDLLELTGIVDEYNNLTELTTITDYQVVSSSNTLPTAEPLATGSVAQEQWESCLVQVSDVSVTNADLGYGEWSVSDGSGDVRIDDKGSYTYTPIAGAELSSITGPLDYTYGDFKIQPRDDNDILEKPPVNLLITGVVDGPLTGGTPKAIEVYVLNDIADLSIYGVGAANNGGGSDGQEFTFPADAVTAGTFLYVASESTDFTTFFGFAPNYTSSVASINGDDAIELFMDGEVVDVFGDINVDGSGEAWEYTDGWAYRNNYTGPDGSTFVLANWSFSGTNALDGESTNATATTPFPIGSYVDPSQQPEIYTSETYHDFGYRPVGVESSSWTYSVTSVNVTSSITVTSSDGAHFQVSNDDVSFSTSTTLPASGGDVYVRFSASEVASYTATITHSTSGADDVDVTVEGNSDYYATTDGKTGDALKTELYNIIKDHTVFSYSDVWDAIQQTDADPNNPDNVILLYTGRSQDADYRDQGAGVDYSQYDNGNGTYDDSYNREHVWAKSHGFPDASDVAYTDIHHLRPCDRSVNTSRSEDDFDWGTTPHPEATECKTATDIWEPRDDVKGDVARMMFYMATRYEGEDGYDLELVDYVGTEPGDVVFGNLTTLLDWHTSDPVDDWERNRNNIIDEYWQGNRNPFIDHPEFAEEIWSDPISIELTTFDATMMDNKVTLSWGITTTGNCVGFNIHRRDSQQAAFQQINQQLILRSAHADSINYSYVDEHGSLEHQYRLECIELDGSSTMFGPINVSGTTNVDQKSIPNEFALYQNYPNPFNPTTSIRFDLPQTVHVTIAIYDLNGRRVRQLLNQVKPAGAHAIFWDATNDYAQSVASGLYYIKMIAGDYQNVKRLTFLK